MADLRIDVAAEFKGKKAFTEAGKATTGLEKAVGKLGKQLLGLFAVSKVVAFGKASVKAFAEDEKAVVRLTSSLRNLGLELAAPSVNRYIDNLSKATAVSDDQLRPSFQALINTTGSLTASQKLLTQAIDVSVGSGIALETVAQDLANAYVGQTRGLRKYNLGLSQAQLKTATFDDLMTRLNKQFSGANAAYLETYAGKLQALSVAGGEAQERIGLAVIDLAAAFAGGSDIDDLVGKIDRLTDRVIGVFDQFTEGIAIIRAMLGAKTWTGMFKAAQEASVEEYNRRLRRDSAKAWEGIAIPKTKAQIAAEAAAERAARKRAADQLKATKALTDQQKKQLALKKAGTVFDMDQIQAIAALKGNLSQEERLRVQAMLALMNENDVLAQQLTKQILMAQDATGGLYRYFLTIGNTQIKNPFAYLDDWIIEFQKKLDNLKFPTMATGTGVAAAVAPVSGAIVGFTPQDMGVIATKGAVQGPQLPSTNVGTLPTGNFTYGQGNPLNTNVYVTVQGSVIAEQDLTETISRNLQNQSLSTGKVAQLDRYSGFFL